MNKHIWMRKAEVMVGCRKCGMKMTILEGDWDEYVDLVAFFRTIHKHPPANALVNVLRKGKKP